MFSKNHYINIISFLLMGVISFFFLLNLKEDSGLFPYLYLFLLLAAGFLLDKKEINKERKSIENRVTTVLIVCSIALFGLILISSIKGNPVLVWLEKFFDGQFPYLQNDPTYFPAYFFLLSPFYAFGITDFISFTAFGLFAFLILLKSETSKEIMFRAFLLIFSPVFFFPMIESGGVVLSSILILATIFLSEKFLKPGKINFEFFLCAILFGAFISTSIDFAVVLIIYTLFAFRNELIKGLLFIIISVIFFFATILPFFTWESEFFLIFGPFINTNSFLLTVPVWLLILILLVTVYTGWMIANLQEVLFSSGIILFLGMIFSMDRAMQSIIQLLIPLSFFILAIKEYKIDKFSGKIFPVEK